MMDASEMLHETTRVLILVHYPVKPAVVDYGLYYSPPEYG